MPDNSPNQSNTSGTLTYQQIAQDANYYSPALYYQLLSQLSQSVVFQPDTLAAAFIPVSDAMYNPDQRLKLFVIGLIPPSSLPTGNIISRTSAGTGPGTANPTIGNSPYSQLDSQTNVPGVQGQNLGKPVYNTLSVPQAAAAILVAYQQQYQSTPTANQLAMYVAQSMTETGKGGSLNWPDYNPGFIGNYSAQQAQALTDQSTFKVSSQANGIQYFNAYQTPQDGAASFLSYIGKFGGSPANPSAPGTAAALNGDTTAYCQALRGYMGSSDSEVSSYATLMGQLYPGIKAQIGDPANLDTASLLASLPPINYGPSNQIDTTSAVPTWVNTGSTSSAQAAAQISSSQNTNLQNTTNTSASYAQQQAAMAAAIQQLINQMAQTPPLQMLVNPKSFKVSSEKVIADGNWTRYGPQDVVEHWGENQDKLEASGKIAAFQAIDTTTDATGPGLTRTARQYSLSYQNFLSLYQIYRNNAGIYIPDPVDLTKTNLSVLGSVYIYFDYTMYVGSFDNFTISENDQEPYTLEYSFTFSVRATFIFDQVQDPNFSKGVVWVIVWFAVGILYFALIGRHKLILSPEEEFALEHGAKR